MIYNSSAVGGKTGNTRYCPECVFSKYNFLTRSSAEAISYVFDTLDKTK